MSLLTSAATTALLPPCARHTRGRARAQRVLVALSVLGLRLLAHAIEPWADARLPVTVGLEMWFDASTLRGASAVNTLAERDAVALWPDGSGHKRDLAAPTSDARPASITNLAGATAALSVVRFDGVNDRLARQGTGLTISNHTVVLVAAPASNAGGFRALLSANAPGKNDYVTGLNLDLGAGGGSTFDTLNAEGAGAGGMRNLVTEPAGFGTFHVLTIVSAADKIALSVDGRPQLQRERRAGLASFEEFRLGARHYSNTADPTFDSGFFHGDLAEVLVFSRALSTGERESLEKHLQTKHAALLALKGPPPEPVIRMLVPGFEVMELPIKLPNINYLTYAADGRLFALGYDGRVHLLRDADGDGLEEKIEPFWYRPTLKAPVSMALAPEGLYVASSRKLSLLRDADGDGLADVEEVVASDWVLPDDPSHGGGVDCMAVTTDKAGNIYFGLGCADYTNPYRVRDGKARYDLKSERGTIIKLSRDRKKREIFATGIRFPYTLAFNDAGDLFCTDQEGATWLPDGNPLDELNHIVKGRHYGFPFRHPKYLPNVIDEPPVVGFGPQHQSTCGMVFNVIPEAAKEGYLFGPSSWYGDALVAGYSRGKIWRVKLVNTPSGYVGKETLIASSRMLLPCIAVSPKGALAVACHSGGPDWGSGPQGPGKLFKILYRERTVPQPVVAWAASPVEVHVAFDQPLGWWSRASATIAYGEYARVGDRFEVLHPPYKAVQEQLSAFRGTLRVVEAKLASDSRTLILGTDPHPVRATYAITINVDATPPWPVDSAADPRPRMPEQPRTYDVAYDLRGVIAEWQATDGKELRELSIWVPHLDTIVAMMMTTGPFLTRHGGTLSPEHTPLQSAMIRLGRLTLRTRLQAPKEETTLRLTGTRSFQVRLGNRTARSEEAKKGVHETRLNWLPGDSGADLTVTLATDEKRWADLDSSYHTAANPRERPIPLDWLFVPWAPDAVPKATAVNTPPPELAGGDWQRGKELFFSEQAQCSKCHTMRGEGGRVGPDLSNLIHRDAASVARDITEPSATINPDFVSYTVRLKDGEDVAGLVRAESAEQLRVVNAANTEGVLVKRADVAELRAEALSIMPTGLDAAVGAAGMKDLLTFLLHAEPAKVAAQRTPIEFPKRTRAEVDAVLGNFKSQISNLKSDRSLYVVLVAGPQDHGPGEHDYPAWQRKWERLLAQAPNVRPSTAELWPSWDQWVQADLVVFYYWNHEMTAKRLEQLDRFLARGGGAVFIHSATIMDKDAEQLAARIGLAWQGDRCKFRHGPLDLDVIAREHPITRGLSARTHFHDESYWPLIGDESKVQVLATTVEEGKSRPMLWTHEVGRGRVFCSILGHYAATFDDPLFRVLLLRGMSWAVGDSTTRFDELVGLSARLDERP
ncbi:MAG: ThuA domain-containing protein [Verrucomicrobia bacterium]|nr:ThuA domain-containing protein [Verrucomicrobiota bacterium]